MSDFSKNLCALLEKQYKYFKNPNESFRESDETLEDMDDDSPSNSVLYAESQEKLEKASGEIVDTENNNAGSEKEKDGIVGDYVKLYKAYIQAENGDEKSIREYLDVVFKLLYRDDKSKKEKQLWIPSNKKGVDTKKTFYEKWKQKLGAFIDSGYFSNADEAINRQWIQRIFNEASNHIEIGKDKDLEIKAIEWIQNYLKVGFIYGDVDSNLSSLKKNDRISKSLLDKCVDDDYFASLFSMDGKNNVREEIIEKDFEMFFRIMENGTDENYIGSEQYRNLLIPLYVDSFTGVSMCIVGRNYFYDKKSFMPCILQVMRLSDIGEPMKNGMSEIYEPAYTYNRQDELKPLHKVYFRKENKDVERAAGVDVRRKVCRNYFKHIHEEYKDAIRDAILLLKELNIDALKGYFSEKSLPEELIQSPFYIELLNAQSKIEETCKELREKITNA